MILLNVKYPKGEIVWTSYLSSSGILLYMITSKPARDYYFLYEVSCDGNLKKLGRAKSPTELEEKFEIKNKLQV